MNSQTLSAFLEPTQGFHASFITHINVTRAAYSPSCSLHLYFKLSPAIFVDPYELSHHQKSYSFRHTGTSNLELPVVAVDAGGSALLLNVNEFVDNVVVKVPVHMRYGEPQRAATYDTVEIPWPVGFVACPGSCENPPPPPFCIYSSAQLHTLLSRTTCPRRFRACLRATRSASSRRRTQGWRPCECPLGHSMTSTGSRSGLRWWCCSALRTSCA